MDEFKYKEELKIFEKANKIFESDKLSWEDKYHYIFSEDISRKFDLDYYDPDTSYEEDICAFICALSEYMEKRKLVYEDILA